MKADNIATAIEDAHLLLQYVAENGISIDEHDLSVLIDTKFSYRDGTLNAESEQSFWRSFTNVTHAIQPVTIRSLKAVHQSRKKNGKPRASDVDKIVSRYRISAVVLLIALLVIQIYLIVGVTAKTKSNELFARQEAIHAKIEEVKDLKKLTDKDAKDDQDIGLLQSQYEELEKKQNANYELLKSWNKIWLTFLFKDEYEGKIIKYREVDYKDHYAALEDEIAQVKASLNSQKAPTSSRSRRAGSAAQGKIQQQEELVALQEALREKRFRMEHDKTQNRFFLNTFSSEYATIVLGRYVLPLLYGLLGAVFFVLRTLSKESQNFTYLPTTKINYRLRIPTGALAGLTVSWFFTGDHLGSGSGLFGFAVAFLVGYNIEILFFVMDKIMSQVIGKGSDPKDVESRPKSQDSQKTLAEGIEVADKG